MNYRLLALDMDGTILDNKKQISPACVQAIRAAQSRGVIVCLATGRSPVAVRRYAEALELKTPLIAYNGARIVDLSDDRVLDSQNMAEEAAAQIYEKGCAQVATVCVWANDKLYVNTFNERSEKYSRMTGLAALPVRDITVLARDGINKIMWLDKPEVISECSAALKNSPFRRADHVRSSADLLEFVAEGASKGSALMRLCDILGIPRQCSMAIGDEENDLSMLLAAGLGVAMGNASDAIKSRCRYVTDTNENNGAAKSIERFILNGGE